MKRAVVQSKDNACFAWSVDAALYLAKKHTERESSYPHYSTVLNLTDIQFPMILSQIKRFENLNDISINVYYYFAPHRGAKKNSSHYGSPKGKHVNLLYVQDPCNDNTGLFAWIKDLSRLVRSQITVTKNRIYFCDIFVYI